MKKFNTEQFKINSVNPELFPLLPLFSGACKFQGSCVTSVSVVEVVSGLWSLPHFPGIHWEVCILTWSGSECSTQIILSPSHGTGTLLKFTSLLWAPFSGLFGPEKIPYASPKILQEWRNPGRTFVSGNSPSFLLWCCCLMQTSGSLVPWHFPGFYLVYEAHVLTDPRLPNSSGFFYSPLHWNVA